RSWNPFFSRDRLTKLPSRVDHNRPLLSKWPPSFCTGGSYVEARPEATKQYPAELHLIPLQIQQLSAVDARGDLRKDRLNVRNEPLACKGMITACELARTIRSACYGRPRYAL